MKVLIFQIMNPHSIMDNPFWPHKSAVELAKDSALSLPAPKVSGAVWTLTEHDIECLCAGTGILSSGGGGNPKYGRDRALKALKDGKTLTLVNPCRFVI